MSLCDELERERVGSLPHCNEDGNGDMYLHVPAVIMHIYNVQSCSLLFDLAGSVMSLQPN